MMETGQVQELERIFNIKVLGRTLEHLGVQMYKRRDTAIAELVANCWDAGANEVRIIVPTREEYAPEHSVITVQDDGSGMDEGQVENEYLIIGRNRRVIDGGVGPDRLIMGRKGIGKLAGFGIAAHMTVSTVRNGRMTEFMLDMNSLKTEDNKVEEVPIMGRIKTPPSGFTQGTLITLSKLKHSTALDINNLRESLSRRFSRTIRGRMKIIVNNQELGEPNLNLEFRFPEVDYHTETLPDGSQINYYYAFAKETIKSAQLRGFTIYVRGKTAQAPPFFFDVEGTASGQHSTKYVIGAIEADFLDEGVTDETDFISTDRQEIDWESERVNQLKVWGEALCRRVLRDCTDFKGAKFEAWLFTEPTIAPRIEVLEPKLRTQISGFLKTLSRVEEKSDRALILADALIRAYEFRQFHDVVADIEKVADDPEKLRELLIHLHEWKPLESRAILEIIKGRLSILDKFHRMIVNDAPETAHKQGDDNIHDLLAGYPWLINPDWQVLAEEKRISSQLKEWNIQEIPDDADRLRYDFLALSGEGKLIIIEIKRSGHPVTIDDLSRLEKYKDRLQKGYRGEIYMVMICGGTFDVSPDTVSAWDRRLDGEILNWSQVYGRTGSHYEHYRAVLEGDIQHPDFERKQREIAQTRRILDSGSAFRGPEGRAAGLGPQDIELEKFDKLTLTSLPLLPLLPKKS
jgi:hypothetical protein